MQADELQHGEIQGQHAQKTGHKKILPHLPQTHGTPRNIKIKIMTEERPFSPKLTVTQACRELGLHKQAGETYYNRLGQAGLVDASARHSHPLTPDNLKLIKGAEALLKQAEEGKQELTRSEAIDLAIWAKANQRPADLKSLPEFRTQRKVNPDQEKPSMPKFSTIEQERQKLKENPDLEREILAQLENVGLTSRKNGENQLTSGGQQLKNLVLEEAARKPAGRNDSLAELTAKAINQILPEARDQATKTGMSLDQAIALAIKRRNE